ncbi:hypothetical protein LZ554_008647 [Drepanopeziza brunnea f. sp. 'monogermtubi']|nr:hypothetical protein LZ554_008647 [Drepanopeziza brunnea f. sp. 'monogermtubi']
MKDVNEPSQEEDDSESDIDLVGPAKKSERKAVSPRVQDEDSESDIDLVGPTRKRSRAMSLTEKDGSRKKAKKSDEADDTSKKATKDNTADDKAGKKPKKPKRVITGRNLSRVEILKLGLRPAAERTAKCSNVYGCHGLILYSLRKGGRREKENPFLDATQAELDKAGITPQQFPGYATKGGDTKKAKSGGEEGAVLERDKKGTAQKDKATKDTASNVTVVWDYGRSTAAAINSLIVDKQITDVDQDRPNIIKKSVMELDLQGLTLGSLAYQVQALMITHGGWSSIDIERFVLHKMDLAYGTEAGTLFKTLDSYADAALYSGALDQDTIKILSGQRKVKDFELRVGFDMQNPMQFFMNKHREGLGSST